MATDVDSEPGDDPERPLSELEKRLFGGEQPPPVPAKLAAWAQDQVARATLRYKGFRQDYERISNAATAQWKNGQITQADAQRVFLDDGHIVSAPLMRRYFDARECRQVSDWLRARSEFHFPGWLSERNRMALDAMVLHGEPAMAVQLVLAHLKKVMDRARQQWRAAGRKVPKGAGTDLSEQLAKSIALERQRLPGFVGEAQLELAELEPWVTQHGSREDQRSVTGWRDELQAVRQRFGLD